VLTVDLDPQSNLTMSQGIDPEDLEKSMFDVLVHKTPIEEIIAKVEVDLAVSSIDLAGAELAMSSMIGRERALQKALLPVRSVYDYILIDTPPSLGLLTLNALVAADAVLIPLNCEYFALEGLADLVATLRRVRTALNPSLDIAGVVMTMYDERTNLGQQVARDIREFFQDRVYKTVIPRNVRLGEAPSHGLPAILYDVKSRGSEAYLALARELLAREAVATEPSHG
jgi:chromosome partitioning protein